MSYQNGKTCRQSGHSTLFQLPVLALLFSPTCSRHYCWFSCCDQNTWDVHKLCSYLQDNAVWNDFKTHFQDNQVPFIVLFGVFLKIYHFIYSGFLKGNTMVSKLSKISGLSSLLIQQGFKQFKGFSLEVISLTLCENAKNGMLLILS